MTNMADNAAERQRRYRRRRREGRMIVRMEIDAANIIDDLLRHGDIGEGDADDVEAIEHALQDHYALVRRPRDA